MRLKKIGFATIATIITLSVSTIAFSAPDKYLVPVEMKKADRTLTEGYIVLSGEEVSRMDAWASGRSFKDIRRRGSWVAQGRKRGKEIPKVLDFSWIKFEEGGFEAFISYGGKKTMFALNFFSGNKVRFTTDSRNPNVLPHVFGPGTVLWIKRTGKARKIR